MNVFVWAVFLGLIGAGCRESDQPQNPNDPPYVQAESAFMRLDYAAAESAYLDVLKRDTTTEHRAEAVTTLANIAWRVRRDSASASRILAQGEADSTTRFESLLERVRMQTSFGNFQGAHRAAIDAQRLARDSDQRRHALTVLAANQLASYRSGKSESGTSVSDSSLAGVVKQLHATVLESPGRLEPARLLVDLSAIAGDGPALLSGWRSYYLVGLGDSTTGVLAQPRRELGVLLPLWSGSEQQPSESAAIARALAASRFFEAALAVATSGELGAYVTFTREIERVTDNYYRDVAVGRASERRWKNEIDAASKTLWSRLTHVGPIPRYNVDKFEQELSRRFGTVITRGETAGTEDLHMGHTVVDERRRVTQYGHGAEIRFVAIDQIVSNGYQSWGWNGISAHGGWGTSTLIVQVRPRYAEGPLRAWRAISDTIRIAEERTRIAADSASDIARARSTPISYFPSIASRLERDGRNRLLDSLRRSGHGDTSLEAAFNHAYGAAELEASIFAHEGRHAIDETIGMKGSTRAQRIAGLRRVTVYRGAADIRSRF